MPITNVYLMEAAEKSELKPNEVVSLIKKQLNVCKLAKFKSDGENAKFYSNFFLSTVDLPNQPTLDDWGIIYNTLLNDNVFTDNLCIFVAYYQPFTYAQIFHPLFNMVKDGLQTAGKNKVKYLANAKATFSMIQMKFQAIANVVLLQVKDPRAVKFLTVVDQTLQQMIFEMSHMIQDTLEQQADPDDIQPTIEMIAEKPLEEDAAELMFIFEHADAWIENYIDNMTRLDLALSEGVVNNAKMKVKELNLKKQKAEKAFDDFIMKKFRDMTIKRRNAKHAEMVGESLRIMREFKRLLKSGALAILAPWLGVLHWIVSFMIDKKTDVKDRQVIVNEIRDEIEIVEEKIAMAERNGDDKAKIELIRFRQKLQREHQRITKKRAENFKFSSSSGM